MNHLPRLSRAISLTRHADHSIHFSPVLAEVALLEAGEVYARMRTTPEGLNEDEAAKRWAEVGPNVVAANNHRGWPWRLITAARNPLVVLLAVLAALLAVLAVVCAVLTDVIRLPVVVPPVSMRSVPLM